MNHYMACWEDGSHRRVICLLAASARHLAAVHRPPFAARWSATSMAAAAAPKPMRHPTPPLMIWAMARPPTQPAPQHALQLVATAALTAAPKTTPTTAAAPVLSLHVLSDVVVVVVCC